MPYLIGIALIIIAAAAVFFLKSPTTNAPAIEVIDPKSISVPAPEEDVRNPSTSQAVDKSDFKDGTYTSKTTYQTPKRDEYSIDVSLTIDNNVIAAANVVYGQGAEKDPNAKSFDTAYKSQIIGKTLDSVDLSRVGGASLTTNAFNDALLKIKADAKS